MSLPRALLALVLPCLLTAQNEISPVFGGLTPGSGIALGVEYRRSNLFRQLEFTAKAIGSVRKYEHLEAGLALPGLAGGRLFAEIGARYRNFPEEDFWGLGPETPKDRRSNYRMEDFDFRGAFGVRLFRGIEAGATGGRTFVNTGPGKDRDWPSIEQVFSAIQVPALERQPDFDHWGAFVRADRRDEPGDPRHGGFYEFRWTSFRDREFNLYDFQRYEIDLRRFLSVFRERDTVAVRARSVLSRKHGGQQIPFFLQPSAGGGNDVRGYSQSRFRDENALVFNFEYRWRVREMVQVVGFADAGRVSPEPGELGLSGLNGAVGAGGRIKLGNKVFLGADLGWSPEGVHVWFRSSHTF